MFDVRCSMFNAQCLLVANLRYLKLLFDPKTIKI